MIHVGLKPRETLRRVSEIMPGSTETIDIAVQKIDGNRVVTALRQPITKPAVASSDIENATSGRMRAPDLGQDVLLHLEQSLRANSPYPIMLVREIFEGQGKVVVRRLRTPTFLCPDHLVIANEPLKMLSAFGGQSTPDPVYLRDHESAGRTGRRNAFGEVVVTNGAPKSDSASVFEVGRRCRGSRPSGLQVRRAHWINDPPNLLWLGMDSCQEDVKIRRSVLVQSLDGIKGPPSGAPSMQRTHKRR